MKLNNRGMSLIEMVVAFAILGVVSVSILGMMVTATRTYTRFTYTEKLQQEAQLAIANIERRVMNCNNGISWNDTQKALFIVNEEGGERNLEVIYLKEGTGELYYGSGDLGATGNSVNLTFYLLAEHVENMNMTFVDTASAPIVRTQAQLEITMKRNDKTYTGKKVIALRNQPANCAGNLVGTEGNVN